MGPRGIAAIQGDILAAPDDRMLAMDAIEILGREAFQSDVAYATLVALSVTGHPASRSDALSRAAEARPSSPEARALVEAASVDSSRVVRAGAMGAVRYLAAEAPWKVETLLPGLSDPEPMVRSQALRVIGDMGAAAAAARSALEARLESADGREAAQIRAVIARVSAQR
jgi:hypothetical protein